MPPKSPSKKKLNYLKAGVAVAMAVYGFICAWDVSVPRFLDRADLVAHEAGHLLTVYLGEFICVISGTLGQIFVPVAITLYFIKRKDRFAATLTGFWTGQSFFNISVYVKDARELALPLVSIGGGDDTVHDWNHILSTLGILHWDIFIGNIFYLIGLAIITVSVITCFYYSFETDKTDKTEERFLEHMAKK